MSGLSGVTLVRQGCQPNALASFKPRNYSWYPLCSRLSHPRTIVRPEGLSIQKFPATPSGIETATFRLATQCLNQWGWFQLKKEAVYCRNVVCCA